MRLSFSKEIKAEIIENKQYRMRAELFQSSGLFMFANAFDEDKMRLRTEILELAGLYVRFAKAIAESDAQVEIRENQTAKGRTTYCADVTGRPLRELILQRAAAPDLIEDERDISAFLSGAFLACGSVVNPKIRYRLDFTAHNREFGDKLARLLKKRGFSPEISERRGKIVIYFDECEQVQDIIAMVGAPRAALKVIDIEMIKQVRNHANRVTNIETANIDKQVDTAMKQTQDIELVLREVGIESLPVQLSRAAELRLRHPEASFRELMELSPEPITRSGLYHRYAAIAKMARKIREEKAYDDVSVSGNRGVHAGKDE